jgi:hypothetical protein
MIDQGRPYRGTRFAPASWVNPAQRVKCEEEEWPVRGPSANPDGSHDLGPWEQIYYGQFDGRRRKRVLVKIIGE